MPSSVAVGLDLDENSTDALRLFFCKWTIFLTDSTEKAKITNTHFPRLKGFVDNGDER
jgi:hypothetical protein